MNIGLIGDEATITGFLLAGAGVIDRSKQTNYFVVKQDTQRADLEHAFNELIQRSDIAVVMVTSTVAEMLRDLIADCDPATKVVMEFPTRESGLFAR